MRASRIRVLIVDDEPPAVERLAALISAMPECEVAGCESRAARVVSRCISLNPDAVLLDIQMPGQDGLEIARQIRQLKQPPALIFVTAHEQHALEAFDVAAVDYLVKPVRGERLRTALLRVRQTAGGLDLDRPAMAVHVGDRLVRLPLSEIRAFSAADKSTLAHTPDTLGVIDEPLKSLEQRLAPAFVRVHRNALVSRYHLRAIRREADGVERVEIAGLDDRFEVSRRNRAEVRALLAGEG